MRKIIRNNLIVFLSYLAICLLIILIDLKWIRFPFPPEAAISLTLCAVFFSFAIVNRNLFHFKAVALRYLSVILISVALTGVWVVISWILLLHFYFAIGGNL